MPAEGITSINDTLEPTVKWVRSKPMEPITDMAVDKTEKWMRPTNYAYAMANDPVFQETIPWRREKEETQILRSEATDIATAETVKWNRPQPQQSTTTINPRTQKGLNRPDVFEHKQGTKETPDAILLEPAKVLIYKATKAEPNTYLPIRESSIGWGYEFPQEVIDYFEQNDIDTSEKTLFKNLTDAIAFSRKTLDAEREKEHSEWIVNEIQNYFLDKLATLTDAEAEVPIQIAMLRRTALSLYHSYRFPVLNRYIGMNKVAVTGIGRENILAADSILKEAVAYNSATWDGRLSPISSNTIEQAKQDALETPRPKIARIFSLARWKDYLNPFKGKYNINAEPRNSVDDLNKIELINQRLNNPSWLPRIIESSEDQQIYYMEYLPRMLFDGDKHENAKSLASIGKMLLELKFANLLFTDIKPSNYKKRASGEVVALDNDSIREFNNWGNKTTSQELDQLKPEITILYAAPEYLATYKLPRDNKFEGIDMEKVQVYALGAMLLQAQHGKEINYSLLTKTKTIYKYDSNYQLVEATPKTDSSSNIDNLDNLNLKLIDYVQPGKYTDLIKQAMTVNPDNRITLEEFLLVLEQLAENG